MAFSVSNRARDDTYLRNRTREQRDETTKGKLAQTNAQLAPPWFPLNNGDGRWHAGGSSRARLITGLPKPQNHGGKIRTERVKNLSKPRRHH
ncbi:hypothetical protein DPEC_G00196070 [Dallia pectoralis]|uniref:Uncharacterized protein n=1 Tax=Dallia pectoralis TaxID=75939 RepID=A0ACC2G7L0_DALPE|nr:hypothetical protein DPEC_G00196070 [Dallia pectoralis]